MKRTNTAKWIESRQRWQINVQKDGKRKTFTSAKPGRAGQREANTKADAWLDDGLEDRTIKVSAVYEKYLERQKKVTSMSNWKPIESRWKTWIEPRIGRRRIESITTAQLQAILDDATAAGKSKKTVKNLMGDITALWKFARLSGWATLVPEELRIPDAAPAGVRKILQPADLSRLLGATKTVLRGEEVEDECLHFYRLLALTGLRPGEALGLEWADVEPGRLRVCRSINIRGEVTRGKNENAVRTVALSALAQAELNAQHQITGRQKRVFPLWREPYIYERWKVFCDHNGLPRTSLYELRHTFVSIAQALPEAQVKSLVGHAKSMDTFGVYGHHIDGGEVKISESLDAIFADIKGA